MQIRKPDRHRSPSESYYLYFHVERTHEFSRGTDRSCSSVPAQVPLAHRQALLLLETEARHEMRMLSHVGSSAEPVGSPSVRTLEKLLKALLSSPCSLAPTATRHFKRLAIRSPTLRFFYMDELDVSTLSAV